MSVKSDIGPFAIVPLWLLQSDISSTALRLFGVMACKYADQDGSLYPSRKTLAADVGAKSARTVDAALDELERVGAITTTARQREDGSPGSNLYVLHFARGGAADNATPPAISCEYPTSRKLPTNHTQYNEPDPMEPKRLPLSPPLLPESYPTWAEPFSELEPLPKPQAMRDILRIAQQYEGKIVLSQALVIQFLAYWRERPTKFRALPTKWGNWLKREREPLPFSDKPRAAINPYVFNAEIEEPSETIS